MDFLCISFPIYHAGLFHAKFSLQVESSMRYITFEFLHCVLTLPLTSDGCLLVLLFILKRRIICLNLRSAPSRGHQIVQYIFSFLFRLCWTSVCTSWGNLLFKKACFFFFQPTYLQLPGKISLLFSYAFV